MFRKVFSSNVAVAAVSTFADAVTLVISGSYGFTGGTGRFADATGGGAINATACLAPGLPFTGRFNGTIDF
jgi:hypothetical protein